MSRHSFMRQYAPLMTPSKWGEEEKRFVRQLCDILDDIYRRYGRLAPSDLGGELNDQLSTLRQTGQVHTARLNRMDGLLEGQAQVQAQDRADTRQALLGKADKAALIAQINQSEETATIAPGRLYLVGAALGGFTVTAAGLEGNGTLKAGAFAITPGSDGCTLSDGGQPLRLTLTQTVTGVSPNLYLDPATGQLKRIAEGA